VPAMAGAGSQAAGSLGETALRGAASRQVCRTPMYGRVFQELGAVSERLSYALAAGGTAPFARLADVARRGIFLERHDHDARTQLWGSGIC